MENKAGDEILDLVDENDQVIGEVEKSRANLNPSLIHREVAHAIFDSSKRILLQRRSSIKKLDPGQWEVCSGHVAKGESPQEAANRELKEELGLGLQSVYVDKVLESFSNETHFMYWFLTRYNGEAIKIDSAEVSEYGFFTRQQFDELIAGHPGLQKHAKGIGIIRKVWETL